MTGRALHPGARAVRLVTVLPVALRLVTAVLPPTVLLGALPTAPAAAAAPPQVQTVAPPRQTHAEPGPIVRPFPTPDPLVLDNGLVRLDFEVDGTVLGLAAVTNTVDGIAPILCEPGAAGWTLRLMRTGTGAAEWIEVAMDGTFRRSPALAASCPADGSSPDCRLDELVLVRALPLGAPLGAAGPADELSALWRGRATLGGVSADFEVATHWRLVPGEPLADTAIRVALEPVDEPLDVYLSQVRYPRVRVTAFDSPDDTLVLPFRAGSLVRNPSEWCFPSWAGTGGDAMLAYSAEVMAYHDGGDPVPTCFYYTTDDVDSHFKRLTAATSTTVFPVFYDPEECASPGPPGWVELDVRHVPDDVFESRDYATPYAVRLGAIAGDWWDVAARYRAFLESSAPWYAGPLGSPSHPAPDAAKRMTASIALQPGYEGDDMDGLAQDAIDVARVLGRDVHTIWYQWHTTPFGEFLAEPYLPGVPSFRSAVETAQARWGITVSPYVNATKGADFEDKTGSPDPCPLIGEQASVHASRLLLESGQDVHIDTVNDPTGLGVVLCPGTAWWQAHLPQVIVDMVALTGNAGVYLDFLEISQVPCYALDHEHAPGGGRWMFDARAAQLASVAAGLAALPDPPDGFVVAMETGHGWGTPWAHLMHEDPALNRMAVLNPGSPAATPMPNAVTIPFFRAVYDNVRLSRITGGRYLPPEQRAWVDASTLCTFGQAPGFTHAFGDAYAPFRDRAEIELYNEFSGPPAADGGDGGAEATRAAWPGDGTPAYLAQPRVTARHLWFMGRLTAALRGEVYGAPTVVPAGVSHPRRDLLAWHTGTLVRLPELTLTPPAGFDAVPGVPDSNGQPNSPFYVEELLAPGMYQAPSDLPAPDGGSLCYVLTNPWIAPERTDADIEADFTIPDFGAYRGWSNAVPYTVTEYDVDGNEQSAALPGGPFDLGATLGAATLAPGDVVWWVFRQE